MSALLRKVSGNLFACASVLLFASSADATIVVPMTLDSMTQASALVVRAKVVKSAAEWGRSKKHIFTFTDLKVLEVLRGKSEIGKTIRVRTLGGEVGEVGMAVAGTPKFQRDGEVVLFVRVDPYDSTNFQIVGMSQGKFEVRKNQSGAMIVVPNVSGLEFARRDVRGNMQIDDVAPNDTKTLSLEQLRKKVSASSAKAPAIESKPGSKGIQR